MHFNNPQSKVPLHLVFFTFYEYINFIAKFFNLSLTPLDTKYVGASPEILNLSKHFIL